MISCNVSQTEMKIRTKSAITEGLVGATCQFIFSPEWEGLAKIVVFESLIAKSIVLTDREAIIPPEVLDNAAGYKLKISIVGKNPEGTVVIPTIWGIAGTIRPSGASDEYEESHWEPTPDYGVQLMTAVNQAVEEAANAVEIAGSVRADADAGQFDGEKGDRGESGVYIGDEAPSEDDPATVWIDTDGDGIDLEEFVEQLVEDSPTITDIKDSIDGISSDLDTVSATVGEHTTALEAKADKSDVESQVAEINTAIESKANKADVDAEIESLNEDIVALDGRVSTLERGGGSGYDDTEDRIVNDVTVDGQSIIQNGVAAIPKATASAFGVVKIDPQYGVKMSGGGTLQIEGAYQSYINNRSSAFTPITPTNLDFAVKAALCDGKGAAYTDAEQLAARERIGAVGFNRYELISSGTLDEAVNSFAVDVDFSKYRKFYFRIFLENTTSASIPYSFYVTKGNSVKVALTYDSLPANNNGFIFMWIERGPADDEPLGVTDRISGQSGASFANLSNGWNPYSSFNRSALYSLYQNKFADNLKWNALNKIGLLATSAASVIESGAEYNLWGIPK